MFHSNGQNTTLHPENTTLGSVPKHSSQFQAQLSVQFQNTALSSKHNSPIAKHNFSISKHNSHFQNGSVKGQNTTFRSVPKHSSRFSSKTQLQNTAPKHSSQSSSKTQLFILETQLSIRKTQLVINYDQSQWCG